MKYLLIIICFLLISCSQNNDEFEDNSYYSILQKIENNKNSTIEDSSWNMLVNKLKNKSYFGDQLPGFSLESADESEDIEKDDIKGKYTLVYFWATWCAPCVANFDYLHKLYDKYKDKNFNILCISHDFEKSEIKKFRKSKWDMPWLNAYDDGKFTLSGPKTYLEREFNTNVIPFKILVDPNSKIIGINEDVSRENLNLILERINEF